MKARVCVTEMFECFPGLCPVQLNKIFRDMPKLKYLQLNLISFQRVYFYNLACAHFPCSLPHCFFSFQEPYFKKSCSVFTQPVLQPLKQTGKF